MIHEKGNRILNAMERKFGHLALPQILRWIAGFQALVWGLTLLSPGLLEVIGFDYAKIISGEFWRIFSWVFFPRAANLIFIIITTWFMFFVNDGIEAVWESFRFNVYVIATAMLLTLAGMLFGVGSLLSFVFYSSVFLAFATLHPNQIIHLMMIIPIKVKWLAIANAALLVGMILSSSAPLVFGVIALLGLLPYLAVFTPAFFRSLKASQRRVKFEAETKAGSEGAFHVCATCQATDESHPEREFRVTADGEEYCGECLEKAKSE